MNLADVKAYLGEDWTNTEKKIRESLFSNVPLLSETNEKLLRHPGKQLRPILCLLIARACGSGKVTDDTIKYAATAEILHNATLLHDDVADASDERRGEPTINALMGPSISVLLGDFWLVKAMDCVMSVKGSDSVTNLYKNTLLHLAEGEMFQLQKASSGDTDLEDYLKIIYDKTASLFDAVACSACISVGASEEVKAKMRIYAKNLGLAFQMRDDIFDYSTGLDTGKPVLNDILERKITLPLLGAFKNSPSLEKLWRDKLTLADDLSGLRMEVLDYVKDNGGLEYAQNMLESYIGEAISALDILDETKEREILKNLATYVGKRLF